MSSTEAATRFVVFLLSVSVVQGHSNRKVSCNPSPICALKGSTVEIRCTFPSRIYAGKGIVWYTRVDRDEPVDLKTDAKYADRVTYSCIQQSCTLKIVNLKERDSANYCFRLITNQRSQIYHNEPGVTLSVTDLKVQVKQYSRWIECRSSCSLPHRASYIWYRNGNIMSQTSSHSIYSYWTDSYSCAVSGNEGLPSPSECVSGQSCNRVTYSDRRICALKGSSVDISCTYNSHRDDVYSKFWFRPEHSHRWQNPKDLSEDSQYSGRVQVLETERGRSTLRITDLRERDSAQYRFKFKTPSFEWGSSLPGTTLTVTDIRVEVSGTPSNPELKCGTTCPLHDGSSYVWFKSGHKIIEESSYFYVGSSDSVNSFACAVRGLENFPSSLVYEHDYEWQDLAEPEDLHQNVHFSHRVDVSESTGRSTLTISDLRERDSAQYRFKFKTPSFEWGNSLPGTTLTVTALQVQVTRVTTAHLSHTVAELNCHSSCRPAALSSFVWFINGEKTLETSSSYTHDFYPGDNVTCAFRGYEDYRSPPVYAPRVALLVVNTPGEIVEGSSATLTCSSDANPAAKYTWYKENQTPVSTKPQLVFDTIHLSDSAEYYCTAENALGRRSSDNIFLNVKYAPKTTSSSVSPSGEIVEGSSVTLTCSSDANPAANYTWYKENQTLPQGPERVYHFSSISSEDRGIYHCRSENQYGQLNSSSLFVDVQYPPKLPSVSVSPSGEIVEGSSVTLTCSSDANPAANYTWYKENENSPKASGQIFTITDFRPEHSGNYYCEAQNTRGRHNSTLNLVVVAGSSKSAAAGSITVILLAIIFISAFLLIRRKRQPPLSVRQHSEPGERPDNTDQINASPDYENSSAAVQIRPSEQQDGLLYSTVTFCKNQEDPLYSNVRLAQPNRPNKEEEENEEGVDYTTVNVNASPRLRHQEDPCALYSTVSKKYKV
ncbi:uncharacterized protein [Trachinotus anak]|uniref:uncharacterized protein isoform X3 n=1 Tax=Trachinotus anak TaxID=443729 RepID=UPI0039F1E559